MRFARAPYVDRESELAGAWRSFFLVFVPWIGFTSAVFFLQDNDAWWLPAIISPFAFLYLRGERYEAPVEGDPDDLVVVFRAYGTVVGAATTGAVAFGAVVSNLAWPGLPGLLLWGLLLLMVADRWKGWSAGYGDSPASVGMLLIAMGALQWVNPWLVWPVVVVLVGGYGLAKAISVGSASSVSALALARIEDWVDSRGGISKALVALFAVGINVAVPSVPGILAWLMFAGLVISRGRGNGQQSQPLSSANWMTSPSAGVNEQDSAAFNASVPFILKKAGLTVHVKAQPASGRNPARLERDRYPEYGPITADPLGRPKFAARMIPGEQTLDTWVKAGPKVASAWGVLRVTVEQGLNSTTRAPIPGVVLVTGIPSEFVRNEPVAWVPNHMALQANQPVSEYVETLIMGEMADSTVPWVLSLKATNLLIGGIPGSGKSGFLNALYAHLAIHRHIEIAGIDLKEGLEMQTWAPRLSAYAEDQEEAVELLRAFHESFRQRVERMKELKIRNAWTHPGFLGAENPVRVLIIDECADLFDVESRSRAHLADEAQMLLRKILRKGRAAGYVVVIATQKPTSDSIPTGVRDLCGTRIAYATGESEMSAFAILGASAPSSDDFLSPTQIRSDQLGQAVVAAGRTLIRVQTSWIEEDVIERATNSQWSGFKFDLTNTSSDVAPPPDMRKTPASSDIPPLVSGLDDLDDDDGGPMPWRPTTPPPPLPKLDRGNEKEEKA